MGTRIIQPPAGNDCIACWPAGETPAHVFVQFSGVKQGDLVGSKQLPNDHLFKCVQDDVVPCDFFYNKDGPGWQISFFRRPQDGRWVISAFYFGVGTHFDDSQPGCPSEHDIWENDNNVPWAFFGWDGIATVIWMKAALELVASMNMPNTATFLELFVKDELFPVYKFCNTRYGMNQKFLISP